MHLTKLSYQKVWEEEDHRKVNEEGRGGEGEKRMGWNGKRRGRVKEGKINTTKMPHKTFRRAIICECNTKTINLLKMTIHFDILFFLKKKRNSFLRNSQSTGRWENAFSYILYACLSMCLFLSLWLFVDLLVSWEERMGLGAAVYQSGLAQEVILDVSCIIRLPVTHQKCPALNYHL